MIRNYIKTAWRNLYANKFFSMINIIGLAIGISASMLIGMIVYYDFSFDHFHPQRERIYRITSQFTSKEGSYTNPGVPVPLINTVKQGIGGVQDAAALYTASPTKVESGKLIFKNPEYVLYTDAGFFKIFAYKWLAGSAKTALNDPNSVVLTRSRAEKYFPKLNLQQVIGRRITYDDSIAVNVSGIVADFDQPTDLVFKEFLPAKSAKDFDGKPVFTNDEWNSTNSGMQVFVKTTGEKGFAQLQKEMNRLAAEHHDKDEAKYGNSSKFYLRPLSELHFNTELNTFNYGLPTSSKAMLGKLAGVAAFLLILACINFINLSTAQAAQRAKEIGVRKTLGGSKKQLMLQFLGETFILTVFAAAFSFFLTALLLRAGRDFMPLGLNYSFVLHPLMLAGIGVLILLVTFLSGFYPALILTRFKPVSVLKNQNFNTNTKTSLRKFLTVSQFVIAQVFIIATALLSKQINFMMNSEMGFKKDAIAFVKTPFRDTLAYKKLLFLERVKAISQVKNASLGSYSPASNTYMSSGMNYLDGKKEVHTGVQMLYGDTHYLDLYGIKLLAGRNIGADTLREFVINETYAKTLGFKYPQQAVGKFLNDGKKPRTIVGVMADFNQRSLKSKIDPMIFTADKPGGWSNMRNIHFALQTQNTQNWPKAISAMKNAWNNIYPEDDFEVQFVDESIRNFYIKEQRIAKLLNWSTGLAVLISCLGLLGLVVYTTEKRTKEIGIRKVLGASVAQLTRLLCTDFVWLVLLGFAIAAPIAYWGIHAWLQDYTYKTSLSWWVFVLSAGGMLLVALTVMSIKTLQAALANPVKSLRTE